MTDDAIFDGWYNRRFSNRESDDCGHGREDMLESWQAATTALLEKLKGEEMRTRISKTLFPFLYDLEGVDLCDKAACTVIEALEKELVG